MWRVTLRGLVAKKFRLALSSLSIALGVAFMAGTFVLTDTLGGVFDGLFTNTTQGVDAVVRSKLPYEPTGGQVSRDQLRPPVPESLVDVVRDVDGVARAEGSLLGYALVIGSDGEALQGQAPTFGLPWYPRSDTVNQSSEIVKGRAPRAPDEVAFDIRTFEDGGFRIGGPARVSFQTVPPREFRVVGTFLFGGSKDGPVGATLSAFTPTTAQEVMNRVGQWDLIEVRAADGVSQTELRDNLRAALRADGLAADYESITGQQLADEQADELKSNLSIFNTFLLVFALVALFVGAFVIYNTFSITVAQRIREIGLLRALGATGRQVNRAVVGEALVVGILSSVIGILLGIGLVPLLQGLLAGFGIDLPDGPLVIASRTIVVSFLVGTVVTVVSSLAPARRASRVAPITALRDQALDPAANRRRYLWGLAFWVVGAVILLVGLFGGASGGDSALLIGAGAFFAFIGVAMLSPLLAGPAARMLTWPARRRGRVTARLASENAERNPRRTASTASALMIGLTLVSMVAVLAASLKGSFTETIRGQSTADFVLSPKGFFPFSPAAAERIQEELPDATVIEYRVGVIQIGNDTVNVLGASPNFTEITKIGLKPGARRDAFARGGLYVEAPEARARNLRVGDTVDVRFPDGPGQLTVQGIYAKELPPPFDPPFVLSLADWDRFPTAEDLSVSILKGPDTTTREARRVVERVAAEIGGIDADDLASFIDRQIAQFDQLLNLVYVLLMLAVVIALVGIVNTLALSVYERTREIGLLRAVGMTRRQLRRMVRGEALIVSAFGALLGLVIGVVFGFLIVQSVSSEGIEFALPVGQLVVFVVLAVLAGLVAGIPPARRAGRLDVLQAITSE
jgi:putative ABC transport system permease protein